MGLTGVKIVRCYVEEYTHHCHVVVRSTLSEDEMVINNNFEILFLKDWDWGCLMTCFSNLVPLKSQRSHLGAPDYLMLGYIIMAKLYHWEVMGLL